MAKRKPFDADELTKAIFSQSVVAGEAIVARTREQIESWFAAKGSIDPLWENKIGRLLDRNITNVYSRVLSYTNAITWGAGWSWVMTKMPQPLAEAFEQSRQLLFDDEPPDDGVADLWDSLPEGLRFTKIESGINSLIGRNVLRRPQFDELTAAAKAEAFTVAGDIYEDTISTIRDRMVKTLEKGASYQRFLDELGEGLRGSFLGPAHTETVYRTNVQSAFRDGRETMMADPVVTEMFPYQEYIHIGDDRVRDEHAAMSKLGLNGTGVYRRDDPVWDSFTPPWGYNCRCTVNPLTKEAAARKGVKEAKKWVQSGKPPEKPEWRVGKIPHKPNPGWGTRGNVGRV